jgi:hypothetical protein
MNGGEQVSTRDPNHAAKDRFRLDLPEKREIIRADTSAGGARRPCPQRSRKRSRTSYSSGCKLATPEEYPGINQDYRNTLCFLESVRPDIGGGHHTEYFDLEGKRKRAATESVNAESNMKTKHQPRS